MGQPFVGEIRMFGGSFDKLTIVLFEFDNSLRIKGALLL